MSPVADTGFQFGGGLVEAMISSPPALTSLSSAATIEGALKAVARAIVSAAMEQEGRADNRTSFPGRGGSERWRSVWTSPTSRFEARPRLLFWSILVCS